MIDPHISAIAADFDMNARMGFRTVLTDNRISNAAGTKLGIDQRYESSVIL